jgi:tetratricopeptide (TPR) repeat protein
VLESQPDHVGANHYYIHATEEFFPEKAVPAADRLRALDLEAGHLVHMPSHIYWRVGRYDDALEINQRASLADEEFFSWCRAGTFYRAAYYPHNVHFLWAAASAEGRSDIALAAARKLEAATAEMLAEIDFLEEFQSIPILTLVRFGRWDAVLGTPRPDARLRYLNGIWHYARGVAMLRKGQLDGAAAELAALRAVAAEDAAASLILAGGVAPASQLLAIGAAHLDGELLAAQGKADAAVAALEQAVAEQDLVAYMEPPPWYFPTRQALGAVLLDAGRAKDAEAVYRRDLEQYPKNGWSLYGLARSLDAQGRTSDADWAKQGHENAWARADVELTASRF